MHRTSRLIISYTIIFLIDFGKGKSANGLEDSVDTIRHYQISKKHFEEKKSRSSSFISSIDDEQKPLFSGIADSPAGVGKAAGLNFEETVPTSGRIHIDKRSHSCKGNQGSQESDCPPWVLIVKQHLLTNKELYSHTLISSIYNFMKYLQSSDLRSCIKHLCKSGRVLIIPKH